MWQWLTNRFAGGNQPSDQDTGDRLVPDDQYGFKFGARPQLPAGLRQLRVAELHRGLLLLENFDVDLTIDQKHLDRTPEEIAQAVRCLRWAKTYHGLDAPPRPPVRLHRNNAALFAAHFSEATRSENDLAL